MMKAYAVFDGGGVKGAALAGALKAAQDSKIEFAGYGGSSAGSIVALLAAVGYTGDELEDVMTRRLSLAKLASDIRGPVASLLEIQKELESPGWLTCWRLRKHRELFRGLAKDLGFSDGDLLIDELFKLVFEKLKSKDPNLSKHFRFDELAKLTSTPLKVVVSDLGRREPVVFSAAGGSELNDSVLKAVRASMSYPFAFRPVNNGDRLLVDGGLCSNLPVFLFDKEREADRLPVIAFDLVQAQCGEARYDLKTLCGRMLDTALEAGDFLMRRSSKGVHHIKIKVPSYVHALDFDLSEAELVALFTLGKADTHEYVQKELYRWKQASGEIEQLQAQHAPARDVRFVLEQFTKQLERDGGLTKVRAHVMLPTSRQTRIVVYQYGMDGDGDQDLELAEDGGCSGCCWTNRARVSADLADAASSDNYRKWKMTQAQQAKVRKDRKTMVSIPIFASDSNDRLIGVLSADSDAAVNPQTDKTRMDEILEIGRQWAIVLTHVLG